LSLLGVFFWDLVKGVPFGGGTQRSSWKEKTLPTGPSRSKGEGGNLFIPLERGNGLGEREKPHQRGGKKKVSLVVTI